MSLNKKQGLCAVVKYIAALLVVNGHLFIFYNANSEFTHYMDLGSCCVALFYFFSGYGLVYNYQKLGKSYLDGFFRKRFTKVLFPLLTAYAVCLPIYACIKGPISVFTLLGAFYWGGPYLKFTWFVSEILIVYLLFYMTMNIPRLSDTKKLLILSVSILILVVLIFILDLPLWYAVSLPGFLIGTWFCRYENQMSMTFAQTLYILVGCSFLWFLSWQWNSIFSESIPQYRYAFLSSFIAPIAFACIMPLLLSVIPSYLCVISLSCEVYLLQCGAFMVAQTFTDSFLSYWITAMMIVIVMAIVVHKINNVFMSKILSCRIIQQSITK